MGNVKKKKLRPMIDILLDMEPLLFEMLQDHGLQIGDLLANVHTWATVHYPGAIEKYNDGAVPIYFYGHPDGIRRGKA